MHLAQFKNVLINLLDTFCSRLYCPQPQQKQSLRTKNVEVGDESTSVQRLKDSSVVQTPAGTNGDNRIYSNSTFGYNECNSNADIIQRQTAWPTSLINASDQNLSDENENEGR